MNAADLNQLLVQVETIRDGDIFAFLLRELHDFGNQVSSIRSV